MSQSDRLFLEENCPTLHQKLSQKLLDDPQAQLPEQDFQDFEVGYSVCSEGPELRLQIIYPFLAEVLRAGSQALLDRVWQGVPSLALQVDHAAGILSLCVDETALGDGKEGLATRRRCVQQLAAARTWLLIGPLVERLRWLRRATASAQEAARKAAPGSAAAAAAAAIGQPPATQELHVRRLETCWLVSKSDRVLVIFSVHLDDEVDVALGRAFCQEFAETNRKPTDCSLPCTFHEPREPPSDLRGMNITALPNVGFLTLTLSDKCVRDAPEDRLYALARPVMTFRNFFLFHLKHAKSYLHSRLRRRLDGWQQQLGRARRRGRQEKRRLADGREFAPPPRSGSASAGPP